MKKGKILVLGTGNAQADFIAFCKNYGFEVFSCSNSPKGRGVRFSDHFELIDITNIDKVKHFAIEKGIDFVYSTGSDVAMPTVAAVSNELGLPSFFSYNTAITCNDKISLREKLKSIPEFSVDSLLIKNEEDYKSWKKFPAIIKPADSQGQRGISKIDNYSQISPGYKKALVHSRSKKVILEEYVNGFEISANIYLVQGEVKFLFITDRISFNEFPGGIIKRHLFPARAEINPERIRELIQAVIKTINLKNGPAYFQIKVDQTGEAKLIEVTPRLDGCHIWRLIKEVSGVNMFKIILDHLQDPGYSGNIFNEDLIYKTDNAELSFFTSPPNISFLKSNFNVSDAVYTEWYYKDGELVQPINEYAEKTGYQIIFH